MSDNKFTGEVLWFDAKRGYGFIGWDKDGVKQKDLFAHFSDIVCEGFKTLYKGQKVTFGLGVNKHGDPKAVEITVVKS
jgi:CspA family cold shock protein